MRLPDLAVRNHRFTEAVVGLLAVLGIFSFVTMPRSEDPMFDLPFVAVVVSFPGADPEVVGHRFAEHHAIGLVDLEGQGVGRVEAREGDRSLDAGEEVLANAPSSEIIRRGAPCGGGRK